MTDPVWMDAIGEVAETENMNEATAGGGGDWTPPAEGVVRLRFVGYIEQGVHEEEFQGKPKKVEKVWLKFELSGPKHPPQEDGTPQTIAFTMSKSLNEKSHFFKLFKRMNYDGSARIMAQLLGKAFLGKIVHVKKGEGDKAKVYANLRDADGYTIKPPVFEDPETGESKTIDVAPAATPIKCFLWNASAKHLKAMWDDIFIDGQYDAVTDDSGKEIRPARSKNYHQIKIKEALNFKGSPIGDLLFSGGEEIDIHAAEKPSRTEENKEKSADAAAGASADPLADMT